METEPTIGELSQRIADLEDSVGSRLEILERRLADLSPAVSSIEPHSIEPHSIESPLPVPPPPQSPAMPAVTPPPPRAGDLVVPPVRVPRPNLPTQARDFNIGVEVILRWVGIALVVLAAGFLVSTAIDRGWISRELQLLGAAIIGAAMLANAVRLSPAPASGVSSRVESSNAEALRLLKQRWALAFGNGGSIVLIVCAGAAYGWLGLWDAATGLGLVAVAAAISLLVAMRTRLESVAVASTAAMFIVPTWARILVDGPVWATGIWLGGFAIVALVVGVERRWSLYRLVSTAAAAAWILGLAIWLATENNTDHRNAGLALVAVVTAVLWLGPALSARWQTRSALSAVDHRSVLLLAMWSFGSAALFADISTESTLGWFGVALAWGFLVVAVVTRLLDWIEDTLFASHLLGAGALLIVGLVLLLGDSAQLVAMAAQALATLLIGYRLDDLLLKLNAALLAAASGLILAGSILQTIFDGSRPDITVDLSAIAVIALLGIVASVAGRREPRRLAELLYGLVWLLGAGFATSLMAQTSYDEGWLVFGVAVSAASLVAARWLGLWVFALGALAGGVTLLGSAQSIADAFARPGPDAGDLVANLVVVLALVAGAAVTWSVTAWKQASRALFVVAWVWSLAWLAGALYQLASPQNQVAISVVWALAAAAAIVAAIFTGDSVVRVVGLATLGAVLFKLLAIDLAEVDTLWRVGLFLVIGLGLLRLGYVLPGLAERYGPKDNAPPGPTGPAGVPAQAH